MKGVGLSPFLNVVIIVTLFLLQADCCPICRTELSSKCFMIPNFSMDNAVEKYVFALGKNNFPGWGSMGSKHREWKGRKM